MTAALALSGAGVLFATEPSVGDPAWLEYVAPLLTERELEVFENLEHGYLQAAFAERFWKAHDPDPTTPRNELRQRWPDRKGAAAQRFGADRDDRRRAFMLNGPPTYIVTDLCPDVLLPIEIWSYEPDSRGSNAAAWSLVFLHGKESAAYELWDPSALSIADLLVQEPPGGRPADRYLTRECDRGREVVASLTAAVGPAEAMASGSGDWLQAFEQEVLLSSAKPLDVEVRFELVGAIGDKTEIDGILTIASEPSEIAARRFEVYGDIFRGDRRAERFRYDFDSLASTDGDPPILKFRRELNPGSYRLELTVREPQSGRSAHVDMSLPVGVAQPSPDRAGDDPAINRVASGAAIGIKQLPLGLLTGRQRIEVTASSDSVARVVYLLDGRQVMRKSRAPFGVELDLGSRPRTHTLEAIAQDANGDEIGRDEVRINTGPHRFRVRLVEPRQGHYYRDRLEVHATVDVPPGEILDRVELFFNETHLATFYQAPFVHPDLALPSTGEAGYIRAVAVLDDENSTEDIAVINTGSNLDNVRVDFVEVYAGVVDRRGRPVTDLTRDEFSVLEDGAPQTIRRFETVKDLPINALVVLDTSESMIEEIDEAEDGALRFFESVLRPKDRAGVVIFSDQPELRVPLTSDLRRLAAGLENIEAAGETTLYDSVVFGLYYLLGLRGKRALVLLTDGLDSQSDYSFDDMLDFARFSGVAIYPIGIGLSSRQLEAQRVLRGLAHETGGACYFIGGAGELGRIYTRIEAELRSQYLLGYQSSESASEEFRRLQVDVERPGLEVRTITGYYP